MPLKHKQLQKRALQSPACAQASFKKPCIVHVSGSFKTGHLEYGTRPVENDMNSNMFDHALFERSVK